MLLPSDLQGLVCCRLKQHAGSKMQPCTSGLCDIVQEAPALRYFLSPKSSAALSGCNRQLRAHFHRTSSTIYLEDDTHVADVVNGQWPLLSLIVLRNQPTGDLQCSGLCTPQLLAALKLSTSGSGTVLLLYRNQQHPQLASQAQHPPFSHLMQRQLTSIRSLVLRHIQLTAECIAQLVSADISQIELLDVSSNRLTAGAIACLAEGSWPELFYLDVSMCALDRLAMTELVKGRWPNLVVLKMSANPDLDDEAISLLSAPNWWQVANVELRHSYVGSAFIRNLMQTGLYLETLDLRWSCMGAEAMAGLAAAHLGILDLTGNNLGAAAMATLSTASMPQLTVLYLDENRLDAAAIAALSRGKWPRLTCLDLSDNCLDNAAMQLLAQGNWSQLQSLKLSKNDFAAAGLEILAQTMWPDLYNLVLDETVVNARTWSILSLETEAAGSPLAAGHGYTNIGRVFRQSRGGQQENWPKLTNITIAEAKTRSRIEHKYNLADSGNPINAWDQA